MKKIPSYHFYLCLYLSLVLASMVLLINVQMSAGYCPDCPKHEVVYRPNDDVLLTMTLPQAREIIQSMGNRRESIPPGKTAYTYNASLLQNILIGTDKLTWTSTLNSRWWWSKTVYLKKMQPNVIFHEDGTFGVLLCEETPWYHGIIEGIASDDGKANATDTFWSSLNKEEAVSLTNAFYVIKRYAEGYTPSTDDFTFGQEAGKYRDMPVKPTLSEEVQKNRILAEEAVKSKNFAKALTYYERGLAVEPCWPQGQLNAALLDGELHAYRMAVFHMKRYLQLVPDATNAHVSQEKIYLWEGKAEEQQ